MKTFALIFFSLFAVAMAQQSDTTKKKVFTPPKFDKNDPQSKYSLEWLHYIRKKYLLKDHPKHVRKMIDQ